MHFLSFEVFCTLHDAEHERMCIVGVAENKEYENVLCPQVYNLNGCAYISNLVLYRI